MEKIERLIYLDIEMSPIEAYTYQTNRAYISKDMIKRDATILSFASKEAGSDRIVQFDTRKQDNIFDDKDLLVRLRREMDKADVIVAHNGKKFDIPHINARLIINGMLPPSPYVLIDTVDIARKMFKFPSNKLSYLSDRVCSKFKKSEHESFPGFTLTSECIKGNPKAWRELRKYNIADVLALEEMHSKMKPFTETEARERQSCSGCSSKNLQSRGTSTTRKGTFARFHCQDCGAWTNVAK